MDIEASPLLRAVAFFQKHGLGPEAGLYVSDDPDRDVSFQFSGTLLEVRDILDRSDKDSEQTFECRGAGYIFSAWNGTLSLQPDPSERAGFYQTDGKGGLTPARPKHHVDPLGKTEAVTPAVPQKRPKTLLERLEELVDQKTPILLVTKSGDRFTGVPHEVTEEVIVLWHPRTTKGPSTIVVDQIESFGYDL